MVRLVFTGYILAFLTAALKADEFLQPWTAGPEKDYSENIQYSVGVSIQAAWDANFTNATIVLTQDNHPGDAAAGPSVTLENSYNKTIWGWSVSYEGIDPAYNNVFYFTVMQANGTDGFSGHYFNISDAAATTKSSVTAALGTGSNTPASSGIMASQSSSSTTGTVTPVTVATVTVAASSGGGMPADTAACIALGIVVGFLLLAGGAWWAWKTKKKRDTVRNTVASSQPDFSREQRRSGVDGNQIDEVHEFAGADEKRISKVHESAGIPIHESAGADEKHVSKAHESAGTPIHESAGADKKHISKAHESAGTPIHEFAGANGKHISKAHESAGTPIHEFAGADGKHISKVHESAGIPIQELQESVGQLIELGGHIQRGLLGSSRKDG